uniref:Dipeptidyl peptidase 9 n=1 Tax=Saccoglossus kowalevskii TaxID=10224 RepID=A0ABM0MWX5_SACKO|nr:PREDICTED: dipeptidyl peptidase 9 [Saccoglossus kowalevskii]
MATGPGTTTVPPESDIFDLPKSSNPTKKSWTELRTAVRNTRRMQTSFANKVPSEFAFRTIQTENASFSRLYFLGVYSTGRENTLLYTDITDHGCMDTDVVLPWQPMLESFQATPHLGLFSKEEQLLRERKRLGAFGITSYDLDLSSGRFLFPACSSLFTFTDSSLNLPVFPDEISNHCNGSRMDAKLCPSNNNIVAFINNSDIWVANVERGESKRLTFVHKGQCSLSEDPKSAGVASYIVQEEFDRYTGYWWQPQMTNNSDGSQTIQILYEEVDESGVEILHISSPASGDKDVDEYRYPRAGTANADCLLKLIEVKIEQNGKIGTVIDKYLSESLNSLYPWLEYTVRCGWTPDGNNVWAQLLSRNQQRLVLVLIPLNFFVPVDLDVEMKAPHAEETSIKILFEEESNVWLNVHDVMHFFPQTSASEISFIWASEKTGYRHLYYITSSLQSSDNLTSDSLLDTSHCNQPKVLKCLPLTSGNSSVGGKQIWVDEVKHLVYYIGLHDTPLEEHLYVVSYINPTKPIRLTELGYSHNIAMSKNCDLFVSVFSSIALPPAAKVYKLRIDDTESSEPLACLVGTLLSEPTGLYNQYQPPELFTYESEMSKYCMHGMVYKPHHLVAGKRYPTVVFVYGGPQVQLVSNSYKGVKLLRLHTLASLGYAVVVIDGRGSCNRGLDFEAGLKHSMGTVEIDDQVEGLQWIANNTDFIDLNRVAIHGWSYGGYLSLMGLAQRPDVFKVAIAGAPVTSWHIYDTGYTEKYMNTPDANSQGYKQGSVLQYVNNFPNE